MIALLLKIFVGAFIFAAGETLSNLLIFNNISRFFENKKEPAADNGNEKNAPTKTSIWGIDISIFKGVLERLVLFVALVGGLTPILVVYGALKIGTRLDASKKERISNDYFLIGNFVSILMAIVYLFLYNRVEFLIDNAFHF